MVEEARKLVQNKGVQAMLLSEKYAIADLNAIKKYERDEGAADLVKVIEKLRKGQTPEEILKEGFSQKTIDYAIAVK